MPLAKTNVQLTVTKSSVFLKLCKACTIHLLSILVSSVIVWLHFLNLEEIILNFTHFRQIELPLNPKHTCYKWGRKEIQKMDLEKFEIIEKPMKSQQPASNVLIEISAFITGFVSVQQTFIQKKAHCVYSDVSWFRFTSVPLLLCRLVYVTGEVDNRLVTLSHCFILLFLHFYPMFQHVVHIVPPTLVSLLLALSVKLSTHCTGYMCH